MADRISWYWISAHLGWLALSVQTCGESTSSALVPRVRVRLKAHVVVVVVVVDVVDVVVVLWIERGGQSGAYSYVLNWNNALSSYQTFILILYPARPAFLHVVLHVAAG